MRAYSSRLQYFTSFYFSNIIGSLIFSTIDKITCLDDLSKDLSQQINMKSNKKAH